MINFDLKQIRKAFIKNVIRTILKYGDYKVINKNYSDFEFKIGNYKFTAYEDSSENIYEISSKTLNIYHKIKCKKLRKKLFKCLEERYFYSRKNKK